MSRSKHIAGMVLLAVLTLGEICSLYWVAFLVWMGRYHAIDPNAWWGHVSIWLGVSLLIGLVWIAFAVWLFRSHQNPRDRPAAEGTH